MAVVYDNKLGRKVTEAAGAGRVLNIFGNDFNMVWDKSTFGLGANWPAQIAAADESYAYDFATITPAHEVVVCLSYITGIPDNQTFTVKHDWYDANNDLFLTFGPYTIETGVGGPWEIWWFSIVGYADWELNDSGNCKCIATVAGDLSDVETLNFTTANVIDANTLKHDNGYMWIEGDNIHFTDYWGWEHTIPKVLRATGTDTPGYVWIEDTIAPVINALYYIDADGDKRRTREAQEDTDLAPTSATPGYLYIVDGYHGNYLTFIGNDGKRYIVSDGIKNDF